MCLLVYAMYPVVNHETTVHSTKITADTLKYLKQPIGYSEFWKLELSDKIQIT